MSQLIKFYGFVEHLAEKRHDLGADTLKAMLTDVLPSRAAIAKGSITEIAAGNGYTAGGVTLTRNGSAQTVGLYSLSVSDFSFTASGGSIGPFRYVVIYNNTATGYELIGYIDKGIEATIASGQTMTVTVPTNLLQIQ